MSRGLPSSIRTGCKSCRSVLRWAISHRRVRKSNTREGLATGDTSAAHTFQRATHRGMMIQIPSEVRTKCTCRCLCHPAARLTGHMRNPGRIPTRSSRSCRFRAGAPHWRCGLVRHATGVAPGPGAGGWWSIRGCYPQLALGAGETCRGCIPGLASGAGGASRWRWGLVKGPLPDGRGSDKTVAATPITL